MTDSEIREPVCIFCKHQEGYPWPYCKAFAPSTIPQDILEGHSDHSEPWPKSAEYPEGDSGIQFEPA